MGNVWDLNSANDVTAADDVVVGDDLEVSGTLLVKKTGQNSISVDNFAGVLCVDGGSVAILTAGNGLRIAEGSNARMGTLTLTGSTPVVVANTTVGANTRIFLTANAPGGTPGHFWVSARSAGTSFSVTGTAGDTSTVAYLLVDPS